MIEFEEPGKYRRIWKSIGKLFQEIIAFGLFNNFHQKWAVWEKGWSKLVYIRIQLSAICMASFRPSLNKPLPEIMFLQYALASILRPLFAGVVCGASLTFCVIVRNGVILKWQRLKIEVLYWKKESMNSRIYVVLFPCK